MRRGCIFSLSPRGTSGERVGERGNSSKNPPPLPGPLLPRREERENSSLCPQTDPSQPKAPSGRDLRLRCRSYGALVLAVGNLQIRRPDGAGKGAPDFVLKTIWIK